MEIKLAETIGKIFDDAHKPGFGLMAALIKAEQPIGSLDVVLTQLACGARAERSEDDGFDQLASEMIAGSCESRHQRLARKADEGDAILDGKSYEDIGEDRMNVEVEVAVDVIQVADEGKVAIDLRAELVGEARAQTATQKVADPPGGGIVCKSAARIDEATETVRRKDAVPLTHHSVQAYVESREIFGQRGGLLGGGAGYHQRGRGDNAIAMGADDPRVCFGRHSEIIGVDDRSFHRRAIVMGAVCGLKLCGQGDSSRNESWRA